jgi:hypothetical protein
MPMLFGREVIFGEVCVCRRRRSWNNEEDRNCNGRSRAGL